MLLLSKDNVTCLKDKGMWAVKLCTNKILPFLTRGVDLYNGRKTVAVAVVVKQEKDQLVIFHP